MALSAVLSLLTVACDHDEGPNQPELPTLDEYANGLEKASENGLFTVALTIEPSSLTAEPASLTVGDATWILDIHDDDGPVNGAIIKVVLRSHDNSWTPSEDVFISEDSDGEYRINRLDFPAPGVWETVIAVERQSDRASVLFAFEIDEFEDDAC